MVTQQSRRFTALDSLRGVAALGVAFHHLQGTSGLVTTRWHSSLSLFVDFFFVLSGFVIAAAYGARLAQGFSALRFMALRLGRVYPLHLFMLLAYVLAECGRFWLSPETAFTGARDPASLPAVLLLVQAFTHPGADLWNVQSWSISVEVWLYVLAALAFRAIGKAAFAGAAIAALAAMAVMLLAQTDTAAPFWPVLRGLAGFGLGMAIFPLHAALTRRKPGPAIASLIELAALAAAALVLQTQASVPLADAAFAAVVLVFAQESGALSRLLLARSFVLIGTISYSIYMVHGFVIGRSFDLLHAAMPGWVAEGSDTLTGPVLVTNLLSLALLTGVVAVSYLSWRFIENPAREWSRRRVAAL